MDGVVVQLRRRICPAMPAVPCYRPYSLILMYRTPTSKLLVVFFSRFTKCVELRDTDCRILKTYCTKGTNSGKSYSAIDGKANNDTNFKKVLEITPARPIDLKVCIRHNFPTVLSRY